MLAALHQRLAEAAAPPRRNRWGAVAAAAALLAVVAWAGLFLAPPRRVHVNFVTYPFGWDDFKLYAAEIKLPKSRSSRR